MVNNKEELAKFLEMCCHAFHSNLNSEYFEDVLQNYEDNHEGQTILKDKEVAKMAENKKIFAPFCPECKKVAPVDFELGECPECNTPFIEVDVTDLLERDREAMEGE